MQWNRIRRWLLAVLRNPQAVNRPWRLGSSLSGWVGFTLESVEVMLQAGDDAGVAGDFAIPAAGFGIFAQGVFVGELPA